MTFLASPTVRAARRTSVALVAVLVVLAAHGVWDQVEATRFARAVEGLQQHGEPVNAGQIARPLESDEQRESSRLYLAAAILSRLKAAPQFQRVGGSLSRESVASALAQLSRETSARAVADPAFAALESIVDSVHPALTLVDLATPLDFRRFAPDRPQYSLLTSDLLQLAAANSLRTDLLSLCGETAAAAASQFSNVRLARTFTGAAALFAPATTGSLNLLLARGTPEPSALLRLQRAYEELAQSDGVANALVEQRALLLDAVWPHSYGRGSWTQRIQNRGVGGGGAGIDALTFLALRPWLTDALRSSLDDFRAALDLAREPWPERDQTARALLDRLPEKPRQPFGSERPPMFPFRFVLSPLMTDRMFAQRIIAAGERLAMNRAAATAIAVERFRREHGEALPSSLNALVPDYLDAIPDDPFDGRPLRFLPSGGGYTVYSVGPDRRDDGGQTGPWVPDVRYSGPMGVARAPDSGMQVPPHGFE